MTDSMQHDRQLQRADTSPGAAQRRLELMLKRKLLQVRLTLIDKDIQLIARQLGRGSGEEAEQED